MRKTFSALKGHSVERDSLFQFGTEKGKLTGICIMGFSLEVLELFAFQASRSTSLWWCWWMYLLLHVFLSAAETTEFVTESKRPYSSKTAAQFDVWALLGFSWREFTRPQLAITNWLEIFVLQMEIISLWMKNHSLDFQMELCSYWYWLLL